VINAEAKLEFVFPRDRQRRVLPVAGAVIRK
jgi:hypothetical protein